MSENFNNYWVFDNIKELLFKTHGKARYLLYPTSNFFLLWTTTERKCLIVRWLYLFLFSEELWDLQTELPTCPISTILLLKNIKNVGRLQTIKSYLASFWSLKIQYLVKVCFIIECNFLLKLYFVWAVFCVMEEARYLFGTNSTNRYKSIHAIASLKLLRSR